MKKVRFFVSSVPATFNHYAIQKSMPKLKCFKHLSYNELIEMVNNPLNKFTLNENISIMYDTSSNQKATK